MALTELEDAVNRHVAAALANHKPEVRRPKVIHDPIHGSNLFTSAEVAVIDLPIIQRLREISQTDIASFVYPSCHHTRFDHTLGVAVIAGRVLDALRKGDESKSLVTDNHVIEVRLAALLHDVGHGPFSHISEEAYRDSPEVQAVRNVYPGQFSSQKPHEMMSYLMVTCEAFRSYFESEIEKPCNLPHIDLLRVGRIIIGKTEDADRYLGDIVNGVFDADKLDYIQRDAYFSGLRMTVDLDRILTSMWIPSIPDLPRILTVRPGAVSALEQILFDKMQLYATIYHHQKVRAAECMLHAIFETLSENPPPTVNSREVRAPSDFVGVTDSDILFGHTESDNLRRYVGRIKDRHLFKRALVICAETVEDVKGGGLQPLLKISQDRQAIRNLRAVIADRCSLIEDVKDVWVDLPTQPSLREPTQFFIMERDGERRRLDDFFPTQGWLNSYESKKWRGHVFCPGDEATRRQVAKCAREFLAERPFNLKLKPQAVDWAKIG